MHWKGLRGNEDTLNALRDEYGRPPVPRDPIPEEILRAVAARPFELDKDEFLHCLRTARRGAAGGPTGMRTEHLRPLNDADCNMFHEVAESFAQASIPEEILAALRVEQMTALQKPNGGVRGIVVGDVIRRLVAKTMTKHFMARFETATKPFPHALATRAGCESIAHAVQVASDRDPRATVLSFDGVGAFEFDIETGNDERSPPDARWRHTPPFRLAVLRAPFHTFVGRRGWVVHEIRQGEGGEFKVHCSHPRF